MGIPHTAAPRHAGRRKASPIPPSTIVATSEHAVATPAPTVLQSSMADAEARRQMIAEAAYFVAEKRGFARGGEVDDWLSAEAEIDRLMRS